MRAKNIVLTALFFALSAAPLRADVKLPAIFGDHMVLQREMKAPLWGWAEPGEKIEVGGLGAALGVKTSATAGADAKWTARLELPATLSQAFDLVISGKNSITLHDVLPGDVWVCSGQSNMEFPLINAHNAQIEIPKADHPNIRLFLVQKKVAFDPQSDCVGQWVLCSPKTVPGFSAVGYFFGREISQAQHVPVGLIGAYWGGTPAEAWTSLAALKAHPELQSLASNFEQTRANLSDLMQRYETQQLPNWQKSHDQWEDEVNKPFQSAMQLWMVDAARARAAGEVAPPRPRPARPDVNRPTAPNNNQNLSTVLSNGMIEPIVGYGIKGAIWYQGESNAGNPLQYRTLFPAMISDWRARWNQKEKSQGDFPFLWVQLANYMARKPDPTQSSGGWAGLREAQSLTLKLPNTGQAVIIDIGQGDDIHPKDKLDVGHRLALGARHVAYGEDLVYSGPTYDTMKIEGNKMRVLFKNAGAGLTIAAAPATRPDAAQEKPLEELKGFAIAGADHKFVWAQAIIEGNSVVVFSPDVKDPQAVRYAWADNPQANLYNKEGLPASGFRTDDGAR